jgi:hydroxyethylthiazole kinase-like sugar kinase family protein
MTGTEIALIITASGTLVTSMTAAALSLRNGFNIKKIEIATNHMKDALVQATAKASHAEGLAEGKAFRQ